MSLAQAHPDAPGLDEAAEGEASSDGAAGGLVLAEPEPRPARGVPKRRDLHGRLSRPKDGLVRLVVDPEGVLVPDVAERLPGRGLWIAANRDAFDQAARKGLFAKAARRHLRVPEGLSDTVEGLLAARCLDTLSLAKRAGGLVAGFDKVAATLRSGARGVVVSAADAAPDGLGKLRGLRRGRPHLIAFGREVLGRQVGREEAVHLFVAEGPLAGRMLAEARRLQGFRAVTIEDDPGGAPRAGRDENES